MKKINIALADDHVLLRNALASLINGFDNCLVVHESGNGRQLLEQIKTGAVPDIVLLDLNMPEMDGFETAQLLHEPVPANKNTDADHVRL